MIDVHTFDGKLLNKFNITKIFSNNEKKKYFLEFKSELKSQEAKSCVAMIINHINTMNNYDPTNKINAEDILMEIINMDYINILDFIDEQLSDCYKLGQCPQGRTTRLFQIWLALSKDVDYNRSSLKSHTSDISSNGEIKEDLKSLPTQEELPISYYVDKSLKHLDKIQNILDNT